MSAATIPSLIEAAARREPRAEALRGRSRSFSYAELIGLAESVSAAVRDRSSSAVVGVLMPAGIWSTIASLGAMRAGRAYMPMDRRLPRERLRAMVEAVGCDCLLLDVDADRPDWFDGSTIVAEAAAATGRPAPDRAGEDQLAYVIFTSGSTGTPNAIGVGQGPAAEFVRLAAERLRLSARDTVLQLHSIGFDPSIEEIWATLAAGARLVCPEEGDLDFDALVHNSAERQVTVLHMPTGYWRALVGEVLDGLDVAGLRSLRHVETGSEVMRLEDLEAWRESRLSDVPLSNGYGPTEAVVTATAFQIGPGSVVPEDARSVPIGAALPGRILYRADVGRQPGDVGELHIGGDLLAAGYLNNAKLTEERFVEDDARGSGRKYRTGDLVREHDGGIFEFVGRVDDQVKVRGFRVELGEISHALRSVDGVSDAATVLLDRASGRLGAAVVMGDDGDGDLDALRRRLAERLPDYMVPPVIVPMASLPSSPTSGKLDSRSLRESLAAADPGSAGG
jgi:amino acid adenylation domain-containing protein